MVGPEVQERIERLGALTAEQRDNILFVLCGMAGASIDKACADLLGPVGLPSAGRERGRHRKPKTTAGVS